MTEELLDPLIKKEILKNTDKNKRTLSKSERLLRKTIVQLYLSKKHMTLFLADDEVRMYWDTLVRDAKKAVDTRKEQWRIYDLKMSGYQKLTDEEKKILGIRKPTQPKEPV
jgi:hypothetical protein